MPTHALITDLNTHAATPHGSTHPAGVHVTSPGVASAYAVGTNALAANTSSGANNIAIGDGVLDVNTTGFNNIALGADSLGANTTGSENIAIGRLTMFRNTTGGLNVAIGREALTFNTTGSDNTGVGYEAVGTLDGTRNTAFGFYALRGNSGTGSYNAALGALALRSITSGANNVGLGYQAGHAPNNVTANATTTGARNTFVGTETGQNSTTQRYDSVAIGYRALVDGDHAVAIGSNARATIGIAIAIGAGAEASTWSSSIALGSASDGSPTTASRPAATGQGAIAIGSGGSVGTITGVRASGNYSIAIGGPSGSIAGASATANFAIAIGRQASAAHANAVALGDASVTTATDQVNTGAKRLFTGAPATAPADAELAAAQFSVWLDETNNNLTFKVKYANGTTIRSGTVALA